LSYVRIDVKEKLSNIKSEIYKKLFNTQKELKLEYFDLNNLYNDYISIVKLNNDVDLSLCSEIVNDKIDFKSLNLYFNLNLDLKFNDDYIKLLEKCPHLKEFYNDYSKIRNFDVGIGIDLFSLIDLNIYNLISPDISNYKIHPINNYFESLLSFIVLCYSFYNISSYVKFYEIAIQKYFVDLLFSENNNFISNFLELKLQDFKGTVFILNGYKFINFDQFAYYRSIKLVDLYFFKYISDKFPGNSFLNIVLR